MSVRAKFRCDYVESPTSDGYKIVLRPVVSGSVENESFYRYTPWGEITLGTVNPGAASYFEAGKEYYVDFVLAE